MRTGFGQDLNFDGLDTRKVVDKAELQRLQLIGGFAGPSVVGRDLSMTVTTLVTMVVVTMIVMIIVVVMIIMVSVIVMVMMFVVIVMVVVMMVVIGIMVMVVVVAVVMIVIMVVRFDATAHVGRTFQRGFARHATGRIAKSKHLVRVGQHRSNARDARTLRVVLRRVLKPDHIGERRIQRHGHSIAFNDNTHLDHAVNMLRMDRSGCQRRGHRGHQYWF